MNKDIVTGTLITCLAVTVCALAPIVGLMGSALIPVPLVFYRAKLGSKGGWTVAAASLAYVVVLGGGLELLFFGSLLIMGALMGELMARRWPLEQMVFRRVRRGLRGRGRGAVGLRPFHGPGLHGHSGGGGPAQP